MTTHQTTVPAVGTYRTVNPTTGEQIAEWDTFDEAQTTAALEKAHAAFLVWREVPIARRVELFLTVADLIDAHMDELARQASIEMGKALWQSRMEGEGATEMFRYYAENAVELLADETVVVPGMAKTIIRREPVGVILGIEPWNAPLYQAMRATAPNLMLGNTVMVKPADICAGSTLMFDPLFVEAGFPEGAYTTILVDSQQASRLIADPLVRGVTLTGSDRAGSIVGSQASEHIKPVVLELGGSDAFIVLDSADVEKAAATAATCRLILGGQACALPKRVLLTDKIADQFIERYVESFSSQTIGDPLDEETTLGPLSSEQAAQTLQDQYDDALAKGATVLKPGGRMTDRDGFFFEPAVITDITPEMRVYSEEAFGPLGLIFRVPDADAAINLANDTKYGLGGAVFSEDIDEARRVAGRLDTGAVGINGFLGSPVQIPFGGTKSSGVGRELGRTGMDQFANFKTYAEA